jgi:hypothetical protein
MLSGPKASGGFEMDEAERLRSLAAWYRDFAERTGNPWIWEARLHHAEALEEEAAALDGPEERAER